MEVVNVGKDSKLLHASESNNIICLIGCGSVCFATAGAMLAVGVGVSSIV